jgi:ankyrin repeat protein
MVCCLVDAGGADADGGESDSQDGNTALIRAAAKGHANCVRLLIDAGADKDIRNTVRHRPPLLGWPWGAFLLNFLS